MIGGWEKCHPLTHKQLATAASEPGLFVRLAVDGMDGWSAYAVPEKPTREVLVKRDGRQWATFSCQLNGLDGTVYEVESWKLGPTEVVSGESVSIKTRVRFTPAVILSRTRRAS